MLTLVTQNTAYFCSFAQDWEIFQSCKYFCGPFFRVKTSLLLSQEHLLSLLSANFEQLNLKVQIFYCTTM